MYCREFIVFSLTKKQFLTDLQSEQFKKKQKKLYLVLNQNGNITVFIRKRFYRDSAVELATVYFSKCPDH